MKLVYKNKSLEKSDNMLNNITLDIICDEYKESLKYYNDFLYYKKTI